jgi:outer membrane protein assembly factor BamB
MRDRSPRPRPRRAGPYAAPALAFALSALAAAGLAAFGAGPVVAGAVGGATAAHGAPRQPAKSPGPAVAWAAWGANAAHDTVLTLPHAGTRAFATRIDTSAAPDQPSVEGDMLFVGTDAGNVAAVNRLTGKIVWRRRLDNQVMSTPVLVGP